MSVYEKLLAVQAATRAAKEQKNGYYNYRSAEQIMQAVKEHLVKEKATIIVKDAIVLIGERYYVKAMATFVDLETGEKVEAEAFAREPQKVNTMGESQVTGATSSYARKYCLGGLLLLDDNKDPDSKEYLEAADIHPDGEEGKPKEKQQVRDKAPAKENAPAVQFEKGQCLIKNDNGIYCDIKAIPSKILNKVRTVPMYAKAFDAINKELDERAMRGE